MRDAQGRNSPKVWNGLRAFDAVNGPPFAPDGHDGFGRPYYFLTVYPPEPDEYRTDFLQVRMVDCRSKRSPVLALTVAGQYEAIKQDVE